ncbi:hormogonium polysaccharide biosynthesis acetyltransferase HpsU [Spirulina subsalsa]|uniref:hormogonium polysaccharide biosynthesis acetyltransferase HpsU n=1 Tax=Spirulina subsalsa TaxID=54311 RepID=UPI0003056FF1|nr:hormogonium polysaccharide biosynthesis acetyltransferase HpsU [Spirulina subsalsa]
MSHSPKPDPILGSEPFVDLRHYDQSNFERGKSGLWILFWWLVQAVTFPLTPHNLSGLRCAILRLFGAKIGKGVLIRPTARFTYPWKVEIGDYTWVGDDVVFYSLDRIVVGRQCVISQKCYLCTGSHDITTPRFTLETAPIFIGNGAWVATDCFVAPGVKIGANAVIGARSSVFGNIPEEQVAWGSPCKPHYARKMIASRL